MICTHCKNEVPDQSKYCNHCGKEIINSHETEHKKTTQRSNPLKSGKTYIENSNVLDDDSMIANKRRNKGRVNKEVLIITSLIVLFLIGRYLYISFVVPYNNYKQALTLMDNSEYQLAIEAFKELEGYKDSEEMIQQSRYLLGRYLLNDKQYDESIDIFHMLGSYKDSNQLKIEAKYLLAKEFSSFQAYSKATKIYAQIKDYKDSAKLMIEANYLQAVEMFSRGDFSESSDILVKIGDYKDAKLLVNQMKFIEKYWGTWQSNESSRQLVFTGNKVTSILGGEYLDPIISEHEVEVKGKSLTDDSGASYSMDNGVIIMRNSSSAQERFSYLKEDTEVPKEKLAPRVGMSAEEVKGSNWGYPSDINKTTTEYGVSEQWVYNNNKYIYLENGIVTSIQE